MRSFGLSPKFSLPIKPKLSHASFLSRILWENSKQSDTESDSDSNDATPSGQQKTTTSPSIDTQALNSSLKRELSEEDEEYEKKTKGPLWDEEISDNLRRYLKYAPFMV